MDSTTLIIFFIALIIFGFLGFLLGKFLTNKTVESDSLLDKEKFNQLEKQFDDFKIFHQNENDKQNSLFSNQIKELNLNIEKVENEKKQLLNQKEELVINLTRKQEELKNTSENLESKSNEIEKIQEKFTKEFENLANKILDEKSNKFTEQNKENIAQILNPLQEKIKNFEQKVDDSQKSNISLNAALKQQLEDLRNQSNLMSKETQNLTKALKGENKTQGNWGELVLENVLEKSGLEKDREYFTQQAFTNDEGKRILPDVIIHLPGNRKMVIDSKVSLTHYERFVNEENKDLKKQYLKEHLNSIKNHIADLSAKNYQDIYKIDSPDFVLLFVPIEPAFAVAINEDNQLYNQAFSKNIVIVTPTTLLATLRTIDSMWNNEKQQQNAIEIARQAGALYDKFTNLMIDLTEVGKSIQKSNDKYASAMNKLVSGKGNLVISVEKLKKLGIKAKKQMPEKLLERADEDQFTIE